MMRRIFVLGWVLLYLAVAQSSAHATTIPPPCRVNTFGRDLGSEALVLWSGIRSTPRNMVRPHNLAWELPVGAATGLLIAKVDRPAANRIRSLSLQADAGRGSNIGLGLQVAGGALAWTVGCLEHRSRLAETGFTTLAAFAAASAINGGLKLSFNRQYPYGPDSRGRFWAGGKSFPSGHAAVSFAFASVVAHRYPQRAWLKWGSYALATGITVARYPAKKHFPSDLLVGATLGYVTGTYLAGHTQPD